MQRNPNSRLSKSVPSFMLTNKTKIVVERHSPGSFVKGRWVEGDVEYIDIEANVQPLKGFELQVLPESDRTKDSIKVYSAETIKTVEEVDEKNADIVVWENKKYRAVRRMTYSMGVLDHTKTICIRLPTTPQNLAKV